MREGYRAFGLSGELAYLADKILGGLVSDVIKVEGSGGDPGRPVGPLHGDVPDPEHSLYWLAYNSNGGSSPWCWRRSGARSFSGLWCSGADV